MATTWVPVHQDSHNDQFENLSVQKPAKTTNSSHCLLRRLNHLNLTGFPKGYVEQLVTIKNKYIYHIS